MLVELTAEGRRQYRRMAVVHTRDIQRLIGDSLPAGELAGVETSLRTLLASWQ